MPLNIRSVLKKISGGVLDTLFPISCLRCGAPHDYLCVACRKTFPHRLRQRCPLCRKAATPRGETCFACTDPRELDGLFAASHYRARIVADSIHTCKYRFIAALAAPLGEILAERLREADIPLPDICIPVPLHPRRLRFRGFNQSALLAAVCIQALAPGLDIPVVENCLKRTRYTKPQMKTRSREERLSNLSNAFAVAEGSSPSIRGKSVWLIDDVATTGTTLRECARVLKKAGARSVFGVVSAR